MSGTVKWYAVRCCCEPSKVFGFIKLPETHETVRTFFLPRRIAWAPKAMVSITHNPDPLDTQVLERVECRMRIMRGPTGTEELAIPSNDHPIEYWRDVEGFVEVK